MDKVHIALVGRTNTGKSSLINCLLDQERAIVSNVAGTTTDPVRKSYEIPGTASVVFIDTPGIDDTGELGKLRVEKHSMPCGRRMPPSWSSAATVSASRKNGCWKNARHGNCLSSCCTTNRTKAFRQRNCKNKSERHAAPPSFPSPR